MSEEIPTSGESARSVGEHPPASAKRLLLLGGSVAALLLFLVLAPICCPVDDQMDRRRTMALLAEIEGGLVDYKIDHGTYPINEADNRDEAAKKGASVLYRHLSGDYDSDGEFDVDDDGAKIYVESLDYKKSVGTVAILPNGDYVAVDSYGNLIRYLCDPPNRVEAGRREIRTLNPTYDLWSLGGAPPDQDDATARSKWITNWGAQ